MNRKLLNIVIGVGAAGAFLGWKFYNKSSSHDELKAELLQKCEDDTPCVEAVKTHFDACFDEHYSLGGRRKSGGLNPEEFLACFNQKAGSEVFVFGDDPADGEGVADFDAEPMPGENADPAAGAAAGGEAGEAVTEETAAPLSPEAPGDGLGAEDGAAGGTEDSAGVDGADASPEGGDTGGTAATP